MSIKEKKKYCKNALIRSAVLSLAIFFLMIYLLWRGPPIETFLVRHMYLRKEFIYYLVCVFFAVFFAWIAFDNIRSIARDEYDEDDEG